jgi:hypothetical protein
MRGAGERFARYEYQAHFLSRNALCERAPGLPALYFLLRYQVLFCLILLLDPIGSG